MGTDLAVRDEQRTAVALSNDQLRYIANSEFVPQGLRGNLPAILACVTTGRALGIDDMSSLRLIHVVNGRPTFSAELMVQLARRAGHSITGEVDAEKAVVKGRRADNGDEMSVTWTMEMGRRAGLANKSTWKSYPESLLWARAVSQLCRMLFADVFAGGTYTPEELGSDEMGASFERDGVIEASSVESVPLAEVASPTSQATGEASGAAPPDPGAAPEPSEVLGVAPDTVAAGEQGQFVPPGSLATDKQRDKLDVLYGKLTGGDETLKRQFCEAAGGNGSEGWAEVRDRLSKGRASALIDHLEKNVAGQL